LAGSLRAERDFLARGNEAGTSRLAMLLDGSRVVIVLQLLVCVCQFFMSIYLWKDCGGEGMAVMVDGDEYAQGARVICVIVVYLFVCCDESS
jgi:hypothetical protein